MNQSVEYHIEIKNLLACYQQKRVCVTGGAGFIGFHLVRALLHAGLEVDLIDNLSTGKQENIDRLQAQAAKGQLNVVLADIGNVDTLREAVTEQTDIIFHQAALGSVPRSFADPVRTCRSNVEGTICVFERALELDKIPVVFASSSSVYGNTEAEKKKEGEEGRPLSPYAYSKRWSEDMARLYQKAHGLPVLGLRYFNVFGPYQNSDGPYAAVIPQWLSRIVQGLPCEIYGDGQTSRDFCPVMNVVYANLLAGKLLLDDARNLPEDPFVNISGGQEVSLNMLHETISAHIQENYPQFAVLAAQYKDFRSGDVRRSLADLSMSQSLLDYKPLQRFEEGMEVTIESYFRNHQ